MHNTAERAPTHTPSSPDPRPPTRWKMWLLLVGGIYPVITILETAADPLLRHLPTAAQFALVVPVMVAVMVWLIIPFLHRHFASWLTR